MLIKCTCSLKIRLNTPALHMVIHNDISSRSPVFTKQTALGNLEVLQKSICHWISFQRSCWGRSFSFTLMRLHRRYYPGLQNKYFKNTYEKLLLDIFLVKNINQFSPYRTGAMFTIKEFAEILTVSSSIYISKSQFTIFKNFKLPPKH